LKDGGGDFYYFGFFNWGVQWSLILIWPFVLSVAAVLCREVEV